MLCDCRFSLEKMVCLGFIGERGEDGQLSTQHNINEWVMNKNAKYEIEVAGVRFPAKPGIYTPKLRVQTQEPSFVPAPNVGYSK